MFIKAERLVLIIYLMGGHEAYKGSDTLVPKKYKHNLKLKRGPFWNFEMGWIIRGNIWLLCSPYLCRDLSSAYWVSEISQNLAFCTICMGLNLQHHLPWHTLCVCMLSCLTLCYPMDCSSPGSPVCGIFPARTLEQVAISFSRGSSRPRDGTCVSSCISCTGRQVL